MAAFGHEQFFFGPKKTSGSARLGSKFTFDLISFVFCFILFIFYFQLPLAFILERKIRNKSNFQRIAKLIPTNLNIFNGSSRLPVVKDPTSTSHHQYFY